MKYPVRKRDQSRKACAAWKDIFLSRLFSERMMYSAGTKNKYEIKTSILPRNDSVTLSFFVSSSALLFERVLFIIEDTFLNRPNSYSLISTLKYLLSGAGIEPAT